MCFIHILKIMNYFFPCLGTASNSIHTNIWTFSVFVNIQCTYISSSHLVYTYISMWDKCMHHQQFIWILVDLYLIYKLTWIRTVNEWFCSTEELLFSELMVMAKHLGMQNIWIIECFFENRLHWHCEVQPLLFTACTSNWNFQAHLIWSSRNPYLIQ